MSEINQNLVLADEDIPSLNTIRVETVLSRLPVHRLARKGSIKIDVAEQDDRGELTLSWKVSYNSDHGQPGPLAYKLDTLIINRRIEESPERRVPRMIRLGSLSEICRELGMVDSGKNRADVKKALLQNASAFIEPNFKYTQADGTESTLDTGFTRYAVILTGKKLPNGQKANSVYISLSDIYLQVIRGAVTRPLDYDYLKNLPPAAQRFYEILSFKMYGTLVNDRPRAKLIYSECCARAPQKRHLTAKVMKTQMKRIHQIHKNSGYITDVDYQEFVDKDGLPDWVMLYKPGAKARAEFRAFQKRGGLRELEIEPEETELPSIPFELVDQTWQASSPLYTALVSRGISEKSAADLVKRFPAEFIIHKVDVFDFLLARNDKKLNKSPSGYLFASITDNYSDPKGFIPAAERQRREEANRQREANAVLAQQRIRDQEAAEKVEREQITSYRKSLTPAQLAEHEKRAIAQAEESPRQSLEQTHNPSMRRLLIGSITDSYIRTILQQQGKLPAPE